MRRRLFIFLLAGGRKTTLQLCCKAILIGLRPKWPEYDTPLDKKVVTMLAKSERDLLEIFNTIDHDDNRLLCQIREIIFLIVAGVLC